MLVNPEGTNPEQDLIDALGEAEQEPTADQGAGEEASEADIEAGEADEDADLEDEADAEDGAEDDDGTARYAVPGQDAKVTLKELTEGYMKDADYRRKTAQLADTRKRVEAVETQFSGSLQTLGEQLELVATYIRGQMNTDDAALDQLAQENPAEFVRVQRQLAKNGSALQSVVTQLQNVRKAQEAENTRKMSEFRRAESEKLAEVNPEFRKPETTQRLHQYLKETYGLGQDDIDSVADHRFALIAEKARRFDAIKAKAALKDKQVRAAPGKFQKAGAVKRTSEAVQATEKAHKRVMTSGKVDDLAALF